ncbi:MAG: histidine kinase [Desulfobacterales bacterium]|nr:MAG: histidine kinase [Desulfobacterales bacterium]
MQADPIKVLVVDDEQAIRQSFSYYLEDQGYEVITAENGRVGLELMVSEQPDLALLDLRMPEMDGLELIQQSKKVLPNTPMIVISGANRIGDVVSSLKYGGWDYIEKPVQDLSILGYAVKKALEKARLIRENMEYQAKLEQMVQERTKELETVNANLSHINTRLRKIVKTTQGMTCCQEITQLSEKILKEFASHMGASGGSLYLLEDGCLKLKHVLDPGHASPVIDFPLDENTVIGKVMKTGQPVLVRDINKMPELTPSSWDGYGDGSALVFPIMDHSGVPVGGITLHSKNEAPFVEQDKEIGSILASYSCETLKAVQAFEAVKKSEQQYRTLFEKSNDAIFVVDRHSGQYIDANRAAEEMLGRPLRDLKQRYVFDAISNYTDFTSSIGDTAVDLGILEFQRPNETIRSAQVSCIPFDMQTFICIARDITQDLEMEKQLQQSQKMEAIGTLAGGIAHDFNNILSGIFGYAQLAEMNIRNPDALKQNLEQLFKGAQRAGDLVQQILTFSRQTEHKLKPLKIYLIVKETVKFLRSTIPASIEIREEVSSKSIAMADTTQIHQVIMNLCANASHAMSGAFGGVLTISLDDVALKADEIPNGCNPGTYIRLKIQDTGIGIPSDILNRIFDPYFTTKEIGQGTGLGLAVVGGIVKKHAGFITVESTEGEGAAFSVFFPVPNEISYRSFGGNGSRIADNDVAEGSERIMLVEDESTILEAQRGILEQLGYKVSSYKDGKAALAAFEVDPDRYDLVITDMTMPRMNGDELSRSILSIRKEVPIILCTGYHETYTKETAFAEGIWEYLQKPVTGKELARVIRAAFAIAGQNTTTVSVEGINNASVA